jgi:hypothetical protein
MILLLVAELRMKGATASSADRRARRSFRRQLLTKVVTDCASSAAVKLEFVTVTAVSAVSVSVADVS